VVVSIDPELFRANAGGKNWNLFASLIEICKSSGKKALIHF
jgi:hypothetical protein